MAREVELELLRASRATQERFVYFLLAGAAAAIGFALTQTSEQALSLFHVPLGLGLLSWGLSFWFGCRFARSADVMLGLNVERVRLQTGVDPLSHHDPERAGARIEMLSNQLFLRQKRGAKEARWQYRLLLSGAAFFAFWRILEMWNFAAPV